ncbi:hypothetical protein P3T39_005380 [Kitasatospora sp. GP82]|nr:hypothetical protein [Kitasatospora sp. GP82]
MAEVVEADLTEVGAAQECLEVPGEGGGFDRVAVGPGEDVTALLPVLGGLLPLLGLLLAVASVFHEGLTLSGILVFGFLGSWWCVSLRVYEARETGEE